MVACDHTVDATETHAADLPKSFADDNIKPNNSLQGKALAPAQTMT